MTLQLGAHAAIHEGLRVSLGRDDLILIPPAALIERQPRWRVVTLVNAQRDDFVTGFLFAATDESGRLILPTEENAVNVQGLRVATRFPPSRFATSSANCCSTACWLACSSAAWCADAGGDSACRRPNAPGISVGRVGVVLYGVGCSVRSARPNEAAPAVARLRHGACTARVRRAARFRRRPLRRRLAARPLPSQLRSLLRPRLLERRPHRAYIPPVLAGPLRSAPRRLLQIRPVAPLPNTHPTQRGYCRAGQPPDWQHFSNTRDHAISGRLDAPANGVAWFDAFAYCRAAGGRLPKPTEWIAAASGTEGRLYPWGDVFNPKPWPYLDPLLNAARPCGATRRPTRPPAWPTWATTSRSGQRATQAKPW